MATSKPKTTIETATIAKSAQVEKAVIEKKSSNKNVKFLKSVRGTYGAFDKGDVTEIAGDLAERFIKNGVAENAD